MSSFNKNYRKAIKGEVCCAECEHRAKPDPFHPKTRCWLKRYVVNKKYTCDDAIRNASNEEGKVKNEDRN